MGYYLCELWHTIRTCETRHLTAHKETHTMNSLVLAIIGIAMMGAGYLLYSKVLGKSIFRLSPNYSTPAHTMEDGVDYVPTNKYVLWGHHFTSVAGAAPIIGPAVAVIWGWVPAFL